MRQRFRSGFYAVLVVGLGLSLISPATHVQAVEGSAVALTAPEDDCGGGCYVGDDAAKAKSICIGVWVLKKFLGRWGWWCFGVLR